MKKITAKFNSTCAETGKPLRKGTEIIYDPANKKTYHLDSNKAKEYIEQRDPAAGMIQAEQDAYFDNFAMYNNISENY